MNFTEIFNIINIFISVMVGAYAGYRFINWAKWRAKGVNVEIDLDDSTMSRLKEIADHVNLSKEKVLEVIIVVEALKIINKED